MEALKVFFSLCKATSSLFSLSRSYNVSLSVTFLFHISLQFSYLFPLLSISCFSSIFFTWDREREREQKPDRGNAVWWIEFPSYALFLLLLIYVRGWLGGSKGWFLLSLQAFNWKESRKKKTRFPLVCVVKNVGKKVYSFVTYFPIRVRCFVMQDVILCFRVSFTLATLFNVFILQNAAFFLCRRVLLFRKWDA